MSDDSLELRLQLKIPFGEISTFDMDLILDVTDEYGLGFYNFGTFDNILAGDIDLDSAESFNYALSHSLLKYADLGLSHYLDTSNPFEPVFKKREKMMILNSVENRKNIGTLCDDWIFPSLRKSGFRVLEGKSEGDIVIGFEEHQNPMNSIYKFDPFLKYDLYLLDGSNYPDF